MSKNSTASGGMSFGTVLFIVFLILKLTGAITWSWWWVTSPLWIPFAVIIIIFGIILLAVRK
jgi:hypothetical protein